MKMITGLTKANCKKYGIEVAPQHNFTDDGNKFRGFEYKGIPMTQCRAEGKCYLSIKVDYLENNFTYKEWMETEEDRLCDEFNGVNEFDVDKLIENLERVIKKRNEMNEAALSSVTKEDLDHVKAKYLFEINRAEKFIEDLKTSFEWWNIPLGKEYTAQYVVKYTSLLKKEIEHYRSIISKLDEMSIGDQKRHIEFSNRKNPCSGINTCIEMISDKIY